MLALTLILIIPYSHLYNKLKCLLIIIFLKTTPRKALINPPSRSPSAPSPSSNPKEITNTMKSSLSIHWLCNLPTRIERTALPSRSHRPSPLALSKKWQGWWSIMKIHLNIRRGSIIAWCRKITNWRRRITNWRQLTFLMTSRMLLGQSPKKMCHLSAKKKQWKMLHLRHHLQRID